MLLNLKNQKTLSSVWIKHALIGKKQKQNNIQLFNQATAEKVLIKTRTKFFFKKMVVCEKRESGSNARTTAAYFDAEIL